MRTVSETEAKRRFAALLDEAQHEPVVVRRQGRDFAVLVSAEDYRRLRAAEAADTGSLNEAELTDIVADDDGG